MVIENLFNVKIAVHLYLYLANGLWWAVFSMIVSWRLNVCHNSQTHLYSMVILPESRHNSIHSAGVAAAAATADWWCCCCCWFRLNSTRFSCVLRMHDISVCFDCCCCCCFAILRSLKYDWIVWYVECMRMCVCVCRRCCAFRSLLLLFFLFFSFLFRIYFFFVFFARFYFIYFVRVPYPNRSEPCMCDVGPCECVSARVHLWRCLCTLFTYRAHFDIRIPRERERERDCYIHNVYIYQNPVYRISKSWNAKRSAICCCCCWHSWFFPSLASKYYKFFFFVRSVVLFSTTRLRRFQ